MKRFRSIALVLMVFLITESSYCQYGVRTAYNLNQAPAWNDFFSILDTRNSDIYTSSLSFELDYWMRLPNHRIEFYPYISFHNANSQVWRADISIPEPVEISLRQIGAGIMTHVYLFDLIGDCECPTFSKQGGFFKKGFFLLGGIGATRSEKKIASTYSDANLDLTARIGIGIDVGVTDLITVSPFAQFQYFPSVSWHEVGTQFQSPPEHVESSFRQIQLGLRIGFRPDYR